MDWNNLFSDKFAELSRSVAESVLKPKRLKAGERRDAAVIFLDLKGFTAMSEELDPEDLVDIICPVLK